MTNLPDKMCALRIGLFVLLTSLSALGQPIRDRVANRDFPSIFMAWGKATNLSEEPLTTAVRHDLIFHGPAYFKLRWNDDKTGLATGFTPESIQEGLQFRQELLRKNPNLLLLAEIRYRDAPRNYLPADHAWWLRDSTGRLVYGWEEGGFIRLDLRNPTFQEQVARQAAAAVQSGVVDGIMIDWWNEGEMGGARVGLLAKIRAAIGPDALILVNSNDREVPRSAPYVNGLFMECFRSKTPEQWDKIGRTLRWADATLRQPRVNCLETWFANSRQDLNRMRATTTLVLTQSDGYALFGDPNELPTPDHLHDWYPFWDARLGKPTGTGQKQADGAWIRRFSGGSALYNPMGNKPVTVTFSSDKTSAASGKRGRTFVVEPNDGDLFLDQ
jgi:hypothetical protein